MSAVLTRPPAAIYREEQNFAAWVYLVLGLVFLLATASLRLPAAGAPAAGPFPFRWPNLQSPVSFVIGVGMPLFLVVCLLRMTTDVLPDACCVTFGWVPTIRRVILLSEIKRVEVVCYRPIRDYGFWGVRTTRSGERIMTAKGNRAVRVYLADESCILIGSQRPEELARALTAGRAELV